MYFSQSKIDLNHIMSELGLIGITSLRMPSVFLIISETTFACTSEHVSIFMLHNAYFFKTFGQRTSQSLSRKISSHLCIEALIIRNRHPVEEQTLFPLSWPLLDCVCHVPDHDVTMMIRDDIGLWPHPPRFIFFLNLCHSSNVFVICHVPDLEMYSVD